VGKEVPFQELARAKVQERRDIVISRFIKGGYTLGMQLKVEEKSLKGMKVTGVFMKGAYQISSLDGLYELRNALNMAIKKEEERIEYPELHRNEEWD